MTRDPGFEAGAAPGDPGFEALASGVERNRLRQRNDGWKQLQRLGERRSGFLGVAKLETARKRVQTPPQVIAAIPAVISLPVPITISQPSGSSTATGPGALPDAPVTNIPLQDLKPLYDFGVARGRPYFIP